MGCNTSKLDGLPAIALCRDRCNFLSEALRRSYAVADAHSAYLHSLSTVGDVLHRFFDQSVDPGAGGDSTDCCSSESSSSSSSPVHSLSSSGSGSPPPKFDSDLEDERSRGRDCDFFDFAKQEPLNSGLGHDPFASMGYTKNDAAHSVFYPGYGSGSRRNYDSGTRTPPPPPPPSSGYAWDFINFFDNYEFPYSVTAKDSKDKDNTRDDHNDGTMKKIQTEESICLNEEKITSREEKSSRKISEKSDCEGEKKKKTRKNDSAKNKEGTKKNCSTESKCGNLRSNVSDVTKELQKLFLKASESGDDVSKMFDSAKYRYYFKSSVYQASSNILHAVSPSFLVVSSKKMNPIDPNPVEDTGADFRSLSCTLKKLFMWEKKLYQEVKAEEKLRTAHMKNLKQLRRMEEKGAADARKVEAILTLIQSLSTRMKVSIHMIDKICVMINTLRDEELWPQMKELIHRLSKMWSSMSECHRRQSRIITEARKLDEIALKGNLDMAQLDLAIELRMELRNWTRSLSNWIDAQKQYVRALNGWLMRCLMQEQPTPEDLTTEEEAQPPPPLFRATHQWSQALERSSDNNKVAEAVYAFLTHVTRRMDKQKAETQQRNAGIGDKEVEKKLQMLEKEEQRTQRYFVQTLQLQRRMNNNNISESWNLKSDLEVIFTSLDKLASDSKQAYQDLDSVCV